jgi:hypothetical protein
MAAGHFPGLRFGRLLCTGGSRHCATTLVALRDKAKLSQHIRDLEDRLSLASKRSSSAAWAHRPAPPRSWQAPAGPPRPQAGRGRTRRGAGRGPRDQPPADEPAQPPGLVNRGIRVVTHPRGERLTVLATGGVHVPVRTGVASLEAARGQLADAAELPLALPGRHQLEPPACQTLVPATCQIGHASVATRVLIWHAILDRICPGPACSGQCRLSCHVTDSIPVSPTAERPGLTLREELPARPFVVVAPR